MTAIKVLQRSESDLKWGIMLEGWGAGMVILIIECIRAIFPFFSILHQVIPLTAFITHSAISILSTQDNHQTLTGPSRDFHKTFTGLLRDLHETFTRLSRDVDGTFA